MKFNKIIIFLFIIIVLCVVFVSCSKSSQEKYYAKHKKEIDKHAQIVINDYRENKPSHKNVEEWTFTFDSVLFLSSGIEGSSVQWFYRLDITRVENSTGDVFHDSILYNFHEFNDSNFDTTLTFTSYYIYNDVMPNHYITALDDTVCLYQYSDSKIEKFD